MSTIISKRKKKSRLEIKNKNCSNLVNKPNKYIEKVNDKWYNTNIVRKKQKEIHNGKTI